MDGFEIRSYSKKELRELYGVSQRVFSSWLIKVRAKLISKKSGNILPPADVELIVQIFGKP
jgi:hypothetical protein